jgi:hypothetical protein
MMKTLSGETNISMVLSEQLDQVAVDLKSGNISNNEALDQLVEFVHRNLKLELSRESLNAKIAGF